MEICCANCEYENHYLEKSKGRAWVVTCPNDKKHVCLGIKLTAYSNKRGLYNNYYNHFKPKEDKCQNCHPFFYKPGKTIDVTMRGDYFFCTLCGIEVENYGRKEDKMFKCKHCGSSLAEGEMCRCPSKMECKPTGKSLTARQVITESKITKIEGIKFFNWIPELLHLDYNLFNSSKFLPYALKHTCFRNFLVAGKYIEKVDTWVPVKVGDKFRYKGEEYIIYRPTKQSRNIGLLPISGDGAGTRTISNISVINISNITKSEFQKICGSIPIDELERV